MPRQRFKGEPKRIYQGARLGRLVELLALDTRRFRDPQPCDDQLIVPCPEQNDPNRTKLGADQKAWLKRRLGRSTATWRLLANQTMMMGFESAPGFTFNPDQWDGYAAERRELMELLRNRRINNVVAMTGDIHTFFAGEVTPTGSGYTSQPVATEFIGGSISSDGLDEITGLPPDQLQLFADQAFVTNPHIRYIDVEHKGYGVVTVHPDELICEFKGVRTVAERDPHSDFTLARFRVPSGRAEVQRI